MVVSQGGSNLISAFGGEVIVSAVKGADGTANGAFQITFNGLGKDACTSLASSDWGTDGMLGIKVSNAKQAKDDSIATGTTAADCSSSALNKLCQPAELPLALGIARSACSSNNQNSISWVYN